MSIPLCPTVLAMAAVEPRDVGGVARELSRRGLGHGLPAHQAATVTVSRVRGARLISKGGARVLRITARGRRELSLQRALAGRGIDSHGGAGFQRTK